MGAVSAKLFSPPMNKKVLLATMVAAFSCVTASASEPTMTKIVTRPVGPQVKANSFAAKPKTLYRAGTKYARTEEELDSENNIQALVVVNEPNTWMINLADKTGRHIVDPGPTFSFHAPIVWMLKFQGQPELDPAFKELEFGNELKFFRENGAHDGGARQVDRRSCKTLVLKRGGTTVILFVDAQTEAPFQIDVERDGEPKMSIRYLEYRTGLPFKHSLFEPPQSVKIAEAK
jgi:hypothetical protein